MKNDNESTDRDTALDTTTDDHTGHGTTAHTAPARKRHRLMMVEGAALVILVILAGIGSAIGASWRVEPYTDHITVGSSSTAIAARNLSTAQEGTYKVKTTKLTIKLTDTVSVNAILREPIGAHGKRPACVFVHGAGTGKASEVYGDIAPAMASAGIVTLVPDKRLDNYSWTSRDYQTMARDYLVSWKLLAGLSNVDPAQVGVYAESEGTWIASVMAKQQPDIAFMILTSPPVVPGRDQMAMAATSYATIAGAPQSVVDELPTLISLDFSLVGLQYADFPAQDYYAALTMPLLINYGTIDPSMPIEQGARTLIDAAKTNGNTNVTVRYYPTNHQMRTGSSLSLPGLPLERHYTHDLEDWTNAVTAGATATDWSTPMIAGSQPHQRFTAPSSTPRGMIGSVSQALALMAAQILCVIAAAVGAIVLWVSGRLRGARTRVPASGNSAHAAGASTPTVTSAMTTTLASSAGDALAEHTPSGNTPRFGRGIGAMLVACVTLPVLTAGGLGWYLATLGKAALSLSNRADVLRPGWTMLQIGAAACLLLLFVLFTMVMHHIRRNPEEPSIATGIGHVIVAVLAIAALVLSIIVFMFWGLR